MNRQHGCCGIFRITRLKYDTLFVKDKYESNYMVRIAECSKALRSGRILQLQACVRIPLLTKYFRNYIIGKMAVVSFLGNKTKIRHSICKKKYVLLTWSGWPSGLRRCVQVAVYNCRRGFESQHLTKYFRKYMNRQHGCCGIFWITRLKYDTLFVKINMNILTWSGLAEWSKALRSGRSLQMQAWVRIPLLTKYFRKYIIGNMVAVAFFDNKTKI